MIDGKTVNVAGLLAAPFTVTTTLVAPAGTPEGTVALMLVSLQDVAFAAIPPNVTVLVPCDAPNLLPAIVICKPDGPNVADNELITGIPFPLRFTNCGLPAASSVTVNVPVRAPVAVGAKVTLIVQLPPAATDVPQLLV